MHTNETEALAALVEGLLPIGTLAKKKNKKMVVIIDDFSNIQKYNGGTVEKAPPVDTDLIERLPIIIARQDAAHYEMIWQTTTQSQIGMKKTGPIRANVRGPFKK